MRQRRPPTDPADSVAIEASAVRLLAVREHSRVELQRKLESHGYESEATELVLDDLAERGYQSDERFVVAFIRQRYERGSGPVKIAAELRERGAEAGAEAFSEPDWFALARQVRGRRFGESLPEQWPEKAKQMRFLQGRGFTTEQIRTAVDADN